MTQKLEQFVAVKRLHANADSDPDATFRVSSPSNEGLIFPGVLKVHFQAFVREISILATIDHPNIVKLIGFVEHLQESIAWMIFPWEGNGNIREFLGSRERLEIPERLSLASIPVRTSLTRSSYQLMSD